ncbi:MAG: DNA mismatch repair endonuclease MutL, partial [Sphaerochaetaceae bacterium]
MHIEHLSPLVAQRIAAGEVIERPASVVRELVDNALDSHAKSIKASIVEGGLDEIIVIDDGTGIEREDLTLCCESHATSKVHTLDDLYHLDTMGFRGEALYSISAVSRVTIASSFQGQEPYFVVVDNGKREQILPGGP